MALLMVSSIKSPPSPGSWTAWAATGGQFDCEITAQGRCVHHPRLDAWQVAEAVGAVSPCILLYKHLGIRGAQDFGPGSLLAWLATHGCWAQIIGHPSEMLREAAVSRPDCPPPVAAALAKHVDADMGRWMELLDWEALRAGGETNQPPPSP